tara:strand:+ start:16865 stop:17392 length:528 start_codon:yes stop_codon:yes gene_type:complete
MSGRLVSLPRIFTLSVVVFMVLCLLYSTSNLSESARAGSRIKETIDHSTNEANDHPANDASGHSKPGKPSIGDAFQMLYDAIRLPVVATAYTDPSGEVFEASAEGPWWTERLRNEILIVDIDTRVPDGANELWNKSRMNWETLEEGGGGMISASQMNHFLYGEITNRSESCAAIC